jgi:hypothetical protein
MSFSGAKHSRWSGILNLRSLGVANTRWSGILNLRRLGVANTRWSGILNLRSLGVANVRWSGISDLRSHELRGSGKFGNLPKVRFGSHGARRFHEQGNSRTSKKQSQRRRLKKSEFSVWTSGRLVNVWDEKDIHVCVHIRNILRARGCFRNVKVPSSPYKKGREGTCKGIHNFGSLSSLWETLSLLSHHHGAWTSLLFSLTCSGILSGFSDTSQHWRPPCFSRKTIHDTTTEEVQEEHSSWDGSARSPSSLRKWDLFHSRIFKHHRSRTESKTRSSDEGKSWEDSTHSITTYWTTNAWERWWWWRHHRQGTWESSTEDTTVLERERKIHKSIASKKKDLWKIKIAQPSKRTNRNNTKINRSNGRTRKQFTVARFTTPELWTN